MVYSQNNQALGRKVKWFLQMNRELKEGVRGEVRGEIYLYLPFISFFLLSPVVFLNFQLFCRMNLKIFVKFGKTVTS